MFVKTIDGTPDAVKVACPVLVGGKAGDYIKSLPIETRKNMDGIIGPQNIPVDAVAKFHILQVL